MDLHSVKMLQLTFLFIDCHSVVAGALALVEPRVGPLDQGFGGVAERDGDSIYMVCQAQQWIISQANRL